MNKPLFFLGFLVGAVGFNLLADFLNPQGVEDSFHKMQQVVAYDDGFYEPVTCAVAPADAPFCIEEE